MVIDNDSRSNGHINAEQRRSSGLPISLSFASRLELARVVSSIERGLLEPPSQDPQEGIEAGLAAIQLMLATGRSLPEVHALRMASGEPSQFQSGSSAWLVRYGQGYALSFPAGKPHVKKIPDEDAKYDLLAPDESIILEVGDTTAKCLRRLLTSARWDVTGPECPDWLDQRPVFTGSLNSLEKSAVLFLKKARCWHMVARRGRLLTLERISAVLTEALTNGVGGDPALAGIITARPEQTRRAASYYCGSDTGRLSAVHMEVIKALGVDSFDPRASRRLQADENRSLGSRFVPSEASVSKVRDKAKKYLVRQGSKRRTSVALPNLHERMLVYTWLMWAVCVGTRAVASPLLNPARIDPRTGFAFFKDKSYTPALTAAHLRSDEEPSQGKALLAYKTRLVWLPPHVQGQLRAYQHHVTAMSVHPDLAPLERARLREKIENQGDGLPFFQLAPSNKVKDLGPGQFEKILAGGRWSWALPMNGLRHYIRSRLAGHVPSETIDALMGHWHVGAEPWSNSSALDPVLYRADLERAYDDLLPASEWPVCYGMRAS